MSQNNSTDDIPARARPETPQVGGRERVLTPEARRALAEAEERRRAAARANEAAAKEIGGRNGPDPVRFGDWEVGGIASDF